MRFQKSKKPKSSDNVNSPPHYCTLPAKCSACQEAIECIDVTRHLMCNLANAIKYIWRSNYKGKKLEDLKKAIWYLTDEIKQHERYNTPNLQSKRASQNRRNAAR